MEQAELRIEGRIGIGVFMLVGGAVNGDFQLDKIQTHLGDGPLSVLQGLS